MCESQIGPEKPLPSLLLDSAAHMRLLTMGLILLLVLRFSLRGLIPERYILKTRDSKKGPLRSPGRPLC